MGVESKGEARLLSALLQDGGRLPLPEALHIARSLLEALRKLHESGVVHRNLHPGCVLLQADGGVAITGLDLAKVKGAASQAPSGEMSGKIATFAPETVLGGVTDERTDLYQCGLILYRLVTGRPAFESQGMWSFAKKVASEDPVAPARVDPAIPQDLSDLIVKSLSRNPADRFRSAAEFAEQLARV